MVARSSLMQPVGIRPKLKLVDVCSSSDESLRACCANSDVTLRQTTKSTCQHQKTSVIPPRLHVVSHPQASPTRQMVNVNARNNGGGGDYIVPRLMHESIYTLDALISVQIFLAWAGAFSHRMQMSRYKKSATLSVFGSASTSRPTPTATTSRLPQTDCEMLLWVKCLLAVAALYPRMRR